jgi:hypothetical protein
VHCVLKRLCSVLRRFVKAPCPALVCVTHNVSAEVDMGTFLKCICTCLCTPSPRHTLHHGRPLCHPACPAPSLHAPTPFVVGVPAFVLCTNLYILTHNSHPAPHPQPHLNHPAHHPNHLDHDAQHAPPPRPCPSLLLCLVTAPRYLLRTKLLGHTDTVEDVVFQPGSHTQLASVGDDKQVCTWGGGGCREIGG